MRYKRYDEVCCSRRWCGAGPVGAGRPDGGRPGGDVRQPAEDASRVGLPRREGADRRPDARPPGHRHPSAGGRHADARHGQHTRLRRVSRAAGAWPQRGCRICKIDQLLFT